MSERALPFNGIHFLDLLMPVEGSTQAVEDYFRSRFETEILSIRRYRDNFLGLGMAERAPGEENFGGQHIIALDCTRLSFPQLPRLYALEEALVRFPVFLVNVNGILDGDIEGHLLTYLRKRKYILPAFPIMPLNGIRKIGTRYTKKMAQLLNGTEKGISVSDLVKLDGNESREEVRSELQVDFPELIFEGDRAWVRATPASLPDSAVRWLGLPRELEVAMGKIYDSNKAEWSYEEIKRIVRGKVDLAQRLFEYANESYAFHADDKGLLRPRFLRRNIHLNVLTHGAWELQRKLAGTFSTTSKTLPRKKARAFSEHHDFETLVTRDREYAAKLGALLRANCWPEREFDKVLVFDNGKQRQFIQLIRGFFPNHEVVRCVHSGDNTRLYPYDQLDRTDRVLILCDVINLGGTLNSMFRLAVEQHHARPVGVFTFIINRSPPAGLFTYLDHKNGQSISVPVRALLSKLLSTDSAATVPTATPFGPETAASRQAEDFLFFWEMVERIGEVKVNGYASAPIEVPTHNGPVRYLREVPHAILLHNPAANDGESLRSLRVKMDSKLGSQEYGVLFSNRIVAATKLAKYLREKIWHSARIENYDFAALGAVDFSALAGQRILILDDGVNTFSHLLGLLTLFQGRGIPRENVDVLVLFSRRATAAEFQEIAQGYRNQCESLCRHLLVYYASGLPLHLIPADSDAPVSHSPSQQRQSEFREIGEIVGGEPELLSALNEFQSDVPAVDRLDRVLRRED